MATTLTPSTLTVTISEGIKLNGTQHGGNNVLSISDITNVSKSIITCLTSTEVAILGVATAESTDLGKSYLAGQFDEDKVRYIRITNLDDEYWVNLTLRNSGNANANEIGIRLDSGQSFIYNPDLEVGTRQTIMSSTSALSLGAISMNHLVDICGIAKTADVELEVFIATI
jgi:hypothetical protein